MCYGCCITEKNCMVWKGMRVESASASAKCSMQHPSIWFHLVPFGQERRDSLFRVAQPNHGVNHQPPSPLQSITERRGVGVLSGTLCSQSQSGMTKSLRGARAQNARWAQSSPRGASGLQGSPPPLLFPTPSLSGRTDPGALRDQEDVVMLMTPKRHYRMVEGIWTPVGRGGEC